MLKITLCHTTTPIGVKDREWTMHKENTRRVQKNTPDSSCKGVILILDTYCGLVHIKQFF